MSILVCILVTAVLFLAYSNGANDNFKGVATLYGSGTASYRRCLIWATATTAAGSALALVLAGGLVAAFSGKGLVPDAIAGRPDFLAAVALGAASTVMLATVLGFPVSTTHALTGALVGAGFVSAGAENLHLDKLGSSFLLPLLAGPVMAMAATLLVYPVFRFVRNAFGVTAKSCICVEGSWHQAEVRPDGTAALVTLQTASLRVWTAADCVERYDGRVAGVEAGPVVDGLHYLSGGAVGFARGLNDTPKIVALLIAAEALQTGAALVLVGLAMAIGGLLNARKVAEMMSRKITTMNPGQGFTANLVTAVLVTTASRAGLPVSTTHVSVGSLFGIGAINGTARLKTIGAVLLAWITTLPAGALTAGLAYLALRAGGLAG